MRLDVLRELSRISWFASRADSPVRPAGMRLVLRAGRFPIAGPTAEVAVWGYLKPRSPNVSGSEPRRSFCQAGQ